MFSCKGYSLSVCMGLSKMTAVLDVSHANVIYVGVTVAAEAKICVGIFPENCVFSSRQLKLIDVGLLQARRLISFYWKKTHVASHHMWVKVMASCTVLSYCQRKGGYILKKYGHRFLSAEFLFFVLVSLFCCLFISLFVTQMCICFLFLLFTFVLSGDYVA